MKKEIDYIEYSERRRESAGNVLKDTNILNILKKFGKVMLIGSYYLNLMVKPDIDIALKVKHKKDIDSTIKKIVEVIETNKNYSVKKIVDRTKFGLNGKSLHLLYNDKITWSMDILVTTDNFNVYKKLKSKVNNKINNEKRRNILKLKYYYVQKKKKVHGLSYGIYISVLENGVTNVKELNAYLTKKDKIRMSAEIN